MYCEIIRDRKQPVSSQQPSGTGCQSEVSFLSKNSSSAVKYRRRSNDNFNKPNPVSSALEPIRRLDASQDNTHKMVTLSLGTNSPTQEHNTTEDHDLNSCVIFANEKLANETVET